MLIGVDIAEIARFENMGEGFLNKCFTTEEAALICGKKSAERAAAGFAAKEAFAKALGTGVRGFELTDIAVLRNELGKPFYRFNKNIRDILARMGASSVELTISHDGGFAVAVAAIGQSSRSVSFCRAVEKTDVDDDSVITYKSVKDSIPVRSSATHKGDYGRIFIVAGSRGMTGAAIMASKAALKSGGGLITLGCCRSLNPIYESALHEVMTLPMEDNGISLVRSCAGEIIERANRSDVLAFGCGISDTADTHGILKEILRHVKVPLIIDADGLNALSRNINILKTAEAPVVLTPHIGEFARLSGLGVDEIMADTEGSARNFAAKWGVTVVLKSHRTVVAGSDGGARVNLLGNPGMATGGSGDVLAGVIASFVGQGIPNAAQCGVYVHSLAGDMSAAHKGEYGMTPTDIIENLPYAINLICGKDEYSC